MFVLSVPVVVWNVIEFRSKRWEFNAYDLTKNSEVQRRKRNALIRVGAQVLVALLLAVFIFHLWVTNATHGAARSLRMFKYLLPEKWQSFATDMGY